MGADVERAVSRLSRRDDVPEATKTGELVRLALELEEDIVLDRLAARRDTPNARFVSHKSVWK